MLTLVEYFEEDSGMLERVFDRFDLNGDSKIHF